MHCASAGLRLGRKQVEAQFVGVAPQRREFPAQAVLHGQGQFHAGGPGADHGDGGGAGVGAHACEQCQPAFVEAADRLHRHRVFGGARHLAELRCRADVDRDGVVADRRVVAAEHLAFGAVDADDLVAVIARAGEFGQAAQVDMHLVEAVMAGDVAGQHAGVGRVGIGADQGQADAGQRAHGEHAQHHHMAVAAADQDDVAQYGAGGLHQRGTSRSRASPCKAARSASGANSGARAAHWACSVSADRRHPVSAGALRPSGNSPGSAGSAPPGPRRRPRENSPRSPRPACRRCRRCATPAPGCRWRWPP
jgi:hypothetical protein